MKIIDFIILFFGALVGNIIYKSFNPTNIEIYPTIVTTAINKSTESCSPSNIYQFKIIDKNKKTFLFETICEDQKKVSFELSK